ncbi:sigma-70 family RNA polymerase sigma factor [Aliifodinibius sp. S!AR15-10]|uniref:sigma-70 family RNA polymerase sigma factor n=1 Tax=Aliifodinibius sp. S!AR15-10 TaxID=2950437 RepID=UPI002865D0ED|nr:sigma-70 family RNA polymerase sigma factor [Aliifodinibius sp. S!AR15-10]MDR8391391.1 sigma-70 family RNA polymerase sigma factor [Aliifodinibius sp. S!AR15-10]
MDNYHNLLFPYAYNVLGSKADAKDAIQDVMAKYAGQDTEVNNEKSYLIRAVINQSINLKNKQKRKTSLEDAWLPEPVETSRADGNIILEDILSYSLLFLLEQLNPKERAVFILKEGFAYSHKEISEVLSCSVVNSRKLLSRARSKVQQADQNPEELKQSGTYRDQIERYIKAIRNRDIETLQTLLSDDVTLYADGGDEINVVERICRGCPEVSDLLIFAYHKFQHSQSITFAEINHQPALLFCEGKEVKACQVYHFDEEGQTIRRICNVLDPDKLVDIEIK